MADFDKKKHWENIYETKSVNDVSWYQPTPQTSLDFIKESNISFSAKIIDIGGGDSFLVDHLLNLGYTDITVLDISAKAIEKAKTRLKDNANKVKWIIADISNFNPIEQYDIWHDRAAFHFLTDKQEIESYINSTTKGLKENGSLIIGTFSTDGPFKCSGIEIKQYSEKSLEECFSESYRKNKCVIVNHPTPFNTSQNFVFCSFTKF
ncbi:MAG: class I SAM-dependent methyltransferase [Flavobacteriales bacterium]|nr:class I SAM-dependent methyltransferase [Flavobacteriales bacterium]NQX97508.1 class I SAM-dependent methyltransferase [Flavobacteriales bacterium]